MGVEAFLISISSPFGRSSLKVTTGLACPELTLLPSSDRRRRPRVAVGGACKLTAVRKRTTDTGSERSMPGTVSRRPVGICTTTVASPRYESQLIGVEANAEGGRTAIDILRLGDDSTTSSDELLEPRPEAVARMSSSTAFPI